jgi:predicted dehydrogenase
MIRRDFIKKSGLAVAGLGLSKFAVPTVFANGSPNEKVVVAGVGVNSRGESLATTLAALPNCEVGYVCDVDSRAMAKCIEAVAKVQTRKPTADKDFRKALEDPGVDALVVAMPDHWHAPAAIIACNMGKHVLLEKPGSHNPREGELTVEAARKNNRIVQLFTQRRSANHINQMIQDVRDGIIGDVFMAKTWYARQRGATHLQSGARVPEWLDWNLWQGPAPHKPYEQGLVHYDWHWFWHWGTGEALNNATHEVDVSRWALGVEFPVKISSYGNRFQYDDDWETPDTQTINMEFPDGKLITWEGLSNTNRQTNGASRGFVLYGTNGSIQNFGGNDYVVYNRENREIKNSRTADAPPVNAADRTNTVSPDLGMDAVHAHNFIETVRGNATLNADIEVGRRTSLLLHLANIAQRTGQMLEINPRTGHIVNNNHAAQALWSRTYEPGWEPRV